MSGLVFEAVSFAYRGGPAVLDGVSFTLGAGERVALLGRNGAGKSTVIRLACALERASGGAVRVGERDAAGRRPEELAGQVGVLFQHAERQLFARTVRADAAFGPQALGAVDAAARVERALDELGLAPHADVHPYDLPGPWRRLAALAGVLALEPAVLLLDEPTAGLDRAGRARVAAALAGRPRAAALVVTHDLTFAAEALDRAVVLESGRVAYDGPLAPLLRDAATLAAHDLTMPPIAALSRAVTLAGGPVRMAPAVVALAQRCRSPGASLD